jgi:hypothetical protein
MSQVQGVVKNFPPKTKRLNAELEARQVIRIRTLSLIQPLGQNQLDHAPGAGAWSVGEIVDHILLAEQVEQGIVKELILLIRRGKRPFVERSLLDLGLYPKFMPKVFISSLEPLVSFFSANIPLSIRAWFMQQPLIPFTHPAQATPRRFLPGDELRSRLVFSYQATSSLFKANADIDFHSLVVRHSILGCLHTIGLLRLMGNHEARHQKQIEKTMRALPHD